MTKCTGCGAEYIHGSGGWAGLCNSCISALVRSKPTGAAIISSNVTSPESPKKKDLTSESPLEAFRRRIR